jgi:exopolyphosphatase/guanosine-5'-triphosphate,3'-diphosphate pyrophosphatase
MRIAIIDLGTNTFNLLIAQLRSSGSYDILLETKYPAKLGRGGINDKRITPDAEERGILALQTHLKTIADYGVEKVTCIATAAIRSASNGQAFVQRVKDELNLDIRVIDGMAEAQMIFDGIKQVIPLGDEKVMVLDIGGGSNEFIIANRSGVFWKHSFNLGIARLLDRFNPSDPIKANEIAEVEAYLMHELQPLFEAIKEHPVKKLIGSSGSFDTISAMLAAIHHPDLDMEKLTSYHIELEKYAELHQTYLFSTHAERMAMKRMDPHRADMIVLASVFINLFVRECTIDEVWQCSFALKEGAIWQIIHNILK